MFCKLPFTVHTDVDGDIFTHSCSGSGACIIINSEFTKLVSSAQFKSTVDKCPGNVLDGKETDMIICISVGILIIDTVGKLGIRIVGVKYQLFRLGGGNELLTQQNIGVPGSGHFVTATGRA